MREIEIKVNVRKKKVGKLERLKNRLTDSLRKVFKEKGHFNRLKNIERRVKAKGGERA